jgi:arabinofuranan 3-O-arabinosyltransferase
MSVKALEGPCGVGSDREAPRVLGIFARWRLLAYGYTFPAFYAAFFVYLYWFGTWLVNRDGVPVYGDFANQFVAGSLALRGEIASIFIPAEFVKLQQAFVGTGHTVFLTWPYPPSYFLLLAPLAMLPYVTAYLTWEAATLVGFVAVVYLIVRRQPVIALALASPFTAWNFLFGQNGFLTGSLIGAALLALERQPVLAGVFIGCLTCKPQLGVLFPVALAAGKQWRAFASAAISAVLLAGLSAAAFGIGPWEAFPRELLAQTGLCLDSTSGMLCVFQSVYGLIRFLHGDARLAWLAQGIATCGVTAIVWFIWRSPVRFALKAATLSAGVLVVTPYALAYDLAAIAIPVAFLAKDQLSRGLLRGEQTTLLALFAASFCALSLSKWAQTGALILLTLLALILRRGLRDERVAQAGHLGSLLVL